MKEIKPYSEDLARLYCSCGCDENVEFSRLKDYDFYSSAVSDQDVLSITFNFGRYDFKQKLRLHRQRNEIYKKNLDTKYNFMINMTRAKMLGEIYSILYNDLDSNAIIDPAYLESAGVQKSFTFKDEDFSSECNVLFVSGLDVNSYNDTRLVFGYETFIDEDENRIDHLDSPFFGYIYGDFELAKDRKEYFRHKFFSDSPFDESVCLDRLNSAQLLNTIDKFINMVSEK